MKNAGRRIVAALSRTKASVTVRPGDGSEVIVECLEPSGTEVCEGLKKHLERR